MPKSEVTKLNSGNLTAFKKPCMLFEGEGVFNVKSSNLG